VKVLTLSWASPLPQCEMPHSKTPLPPEAEAAEAMSLSESMHEQGDQDDDRDWHAKKEQQ